MITVTERVIATEEALALIDLLTARHGNIMFHLNLESLMCLLERMDLESLLYWRQ